MRVESYCLPANLYLIRQVLGRSTKPAKPVSQPTNHILVLDCSGSMSYDLPRIREQLKAKLPKLLGEQDTVSIIWFSGRGQFGTLLESEPVATLTDLQAVNQAIDRWLRPVGLTGFKEPLQEASALVKRVQKKHPGSCSLFFMSDGCDNQWVRPEILKAVDEAAGGLAAATFVEYGYYADRPLLTAMAERAGGQLIFANDFDRYQPAIEASLSKRPTGAKRVEADVAGDPIGGFVWTMADGELTTYAIENGKVRVPEDATELWAISPVSDGPYTRLQEDARWPDPELAAMYAAMSLYSVRMRSDVIFPLLTATGDVELIESFGSCFGKQMYSSFMDRAKLAAFDATTRYTQGYDPSKVPAEDAFTVLELLELLASDDANRVLLDHPEFKYARISRGRVDSNLVLTDEEQAQVDALVAKMQGERDVRKLAALQTQIDQITAGKKALEFRPDPAPDGYEIGSLVFNEDRPNVGFNVRQTGTVDLSEKLPAEHAAVPKIFPTFRFRTYAVVRDGLVNVEKLPVRVTQRVGDELARLLPDAAKPDAASVHQVGELWEGVINVAALPVINRRMVRAVSARDLFEKQWALETARAAQKAYKGYKDAYVPRKESRSFKLTYGEAAAEWLREAGFTDYSGFNPKSVQAESTDYYVGKALEVKIKGLSSLPKVDEVKKKIEAIKADPKGKVKHTTGTALMAPFVEDCEALEKTAPPDLVQQLDVRAKQAVSDARRRIFEIARIKFSILVGQTWPTEFATIDENSITMDFGGQKLECKLDLKEVEIRI